MTTTQSQTTAVRVDLGARGYDILIGKGLMETLAARLMTLIKRPRVFILSDETVWKLHGEALTHTLSRAGIGAAVTLVPPGEKSKSFAALENLLGWLLEHEADRSDILIAFGGGIVGDLGGLAASLMKRGMNYVQVPTTLLAQVDSSVGGKTAINTPHGKNMIGQFYQPRLVVADAALLETLPERQIRAGYAEIVKYGLINDAPFFEWLEKYGKHVLALRADAIAEAVARSCASKAAIVAEDEREGGRRALLNLGHTFGHALEAVNGYTPDLLHGEAIACGMGLACRYSERSGLINASDVKRVEKHLSESGLSPRLKSLKGGPYEADALVAAMAQDKKARSGQVPLILVRGIGKAFINPNSDLLDVKAFLAEELQR